MEKSFATTKTIEAQVETTRNMEVNRKSRNLHPPSALRGTRRNRHLRQMLVAAVVGGALIAVPQVAKAGPHPLDSTDTVNSGPGISITDNDASVTTTDIDFHVNATTGDALTISGAGAISYNDGANNNDLFTSGTIGDGLSITSTGDISSGNDGSITVVSSGNITGFRRGITAVNNGSGNISITANGAVTATGNNAFSDGINASNTSGGKDITVTATNSNIISGTKNGINVSNSGTGDTIVESNGAITGVERDGILIENTVDATGVLEVKANNVTGNNFGIRAINRGDSDVSVTSTGIVTAATNDGIQVTNQKATGTGSVTVDVNIVNGGNHGISAVNQNNTGSINITASGDVTGDTDNDGSGVGIYARNDGAALTIDTEGKVSGAVGINAINDGSGLTKITNTATVTGTDGDGILAENATTATDLTIEANSVTGTDNGIYAQNNGTGETYVKITSGTVEGTGGDGIYVESTDTANPHSLNVVAGGGGVTADVIGENHGINVNNAGTGNVQIYNYGTVTGNTGDGIHALVNTSQTLTVTGTTVQGGVNGIFAQNIGTGNTTITTLGKVTATTGDGIYAAGTSTDAGNLTVQANDVTGGQYGINVANSGTASATAVTTNGEVQGSEAGIRIKSTSITETAILTINNESVVRNSSGYTDDLAIEISGESGGTATIINDGSITGNVNGGNENLTLTNNFFWDSSEGSTNLGNGDDTLINNNVWDNTGGITNFGNGEDVFNNAGILWAANPNAISNTQIRGVEQVNNNGGVLAMQNGEVGDKLTFTSGSGGFNPSGGVFNANGGVLTVDTDITTGVSDRLIVDNVIGGTMGVDVNLIDGLGQPTIDDGVLIVEVVGDGYGAGTSSSDAFALTSPLSGGLFEYDLNQGSNSPNWFLQSDVRSEAAATGVLSILGSRTALSTLSNLHDRQRDVKVLLENANSVKGVWARAFGQANDFRSQDFGFDSNLWGVQAGLDLKASGDQDGNRKYAGLYVAYATSSGNARHHDIKVADIDLNATTFGAYYTKYSASNWYLDLVAQYSRLGGVKAKTATDEIKPNGNSYALSLEAGKQFNPDSSIIREVQAQLINQYTDLNDVELNDGSELNLSSMNVVTGRFGVRLYGNPKSGKSFLPWLRANIWHTFSGKSTISSLGSSISTPIGGTSGELELGFSKGHAESGGWGIYGSAGYLFDISGAEYSGWKGTLGVRKGW